MAIQPKTTTLQDYCMLLFRKAVHPEWFRIAGRRRYEQGAYDFESWIFPGGHSLRFEYEGVCATEVVTQHPENLPESGLVTAIPCAGEHDLNETFGDQVTFMISIQTEILSDHLYLGTFTELSDHGQRSESLMSTWEEDGRPNLSMVELQFHNDQVHAQAYHLHGDCGLVLRSQSIFQVGVVDTEQK